MKPYLLRPVYGWVLLACLALAVGCSGAEQQAKPPVALTPDQARQLQQRVAQVQAQVAQIDARIAELRREQALALAELTTDTRSALAELSLVNQQLGGKPVPPPAAHPAGKGAPAAEADKSPLSPLMRLLLIIVAVGAIVIIVKIFMGRLEEDEDDDDEDLAAELGDDEPPAQEAVAPKMDTPPAEDPGAADGKPGHEGTDSKA